MKVTYSKYEFRAMQDTVDEVLEKVREHIDEDVEDLNLVESIKHQAMKCMTYSVLPDGSVELDINVEYALDAIDTYKEFLVGLVPIVGNIMKLSDNLSSKLFNLGMKWM